MKTIACLLGIVLLPVAAFAAEKKSKAPVPNASLSDVKWGKPVNTAGFDKNTLTGKVVVVEEWGVNCPECLAGLPKLAKMAKAGADKGLAVIGFECQNGTKENILKVLKSTRVEYPIQTWGSAPGNTEGSIPYVCVFDVTGKLVFNGSPSEDGFEAAVKKALRDVKSN
ncbi:MAG: TlpA disulfide reductase family protein [Luteolibacter sp.]|uniref:TlpA family protein disulfide reductase n=1 Tax=Luteolibacter sp. TaxID=1962973 RepID=UPI003267958D